MTRITGFLAATLAAALCLLIGVVIGRDSRTPDYPDTYPPEGDDGIDPPDPRTIDADREMNRLNSDPWTLPGGVR